MSDPSLPLILCIVGARPNFMKIAPILSALRSGHSGLRAQLVHTGQHYDEAMYQQLFADLGIPPPDIDLEVGSGTHAVQTARIMDRFEPVLDTLNPAAILVVGDVNSTIACALVAAKKQIPVIHVEAGLRSFDRAMPEEINRVLTDQISDFLFTTELQAKDNLIREGIDAEKIHFVGNVMIDTLHHNLSRAIPAATTFSRNGLPAVFSGTPRSFGVLTLHRPSNVDDPVVLRNLLETLEEVSRHIPLAFPLHPRTRQKIDEFHLTEFLNLPTLAILPPLGYLPLLGLMKDARLFLTDSGGIQEETTALGIPCVTLRENTERPITVDQGSNTIVGQDRARILATVLNILAGRGKAGRIPDYWDGQAAWRITAHLRAVFNPHFVAPAAMTGI
ncbi:MAG: UDP-N-acetylglucosamine 2-epimerase (non-hydrolyzing) [Ferrovum sp.]|nr:UDP-N-acetylglucosamine 2-epimerase (non-hydrolyzing) [Ferrovum sp.]NDU88420.1 UDP-N-acetylglucosamine 2-epimerase (non-hydrolyzing) [Ferrovum sp.]